MEFHKGRQDFLLISKAYPHIVSNVPELSLKAPAKRDAAGQGGKKGYLNLEFKR
jgi:hypothetical protein